MQKLLIRLALLLGSVGLLAGLGLWLGLRRGYVDAFYARFAAPPAASLVLGSSRAAQGIRPDVLAARLGRRYDGPWLNYAFTLAESPYGPGYYSSIERKLASGTQHGLFVLSVDPWSLSLPNDMKYRQAAPMYDALGVGGQEVILPEENSMVSRLASVSQNPNLDYLAHYLHQPFYQLLLPRDTTQVVERLHPDGWLEIALPPPTANPALYQRRAAGKLATYRTLAATYHLSALRLRFLEAIITLLRSHGQVVLVRLPTGRDMETLENRYQPDFEVRLCAIARKMGVPYLSYQARAYPTNDGNHLTRLAARQLSQQLATDIAQLPDQVYAKPD